jgi:bacillithiol biosynthesis cysteine-adding enzyme BshC
VLDNSVSTPARALSVDIRRFPWSRRLAADYAFHFEQLNDFFAGNPAEPAAWRDAIARAQRHPRDRERLAALLQAQQRERGAPSEAVAAAGVLRDPASVAIVTGQQAGLFGGPLFGLLKALTALRQAKRIQAEQGVPAVAIFWVEAEDHDWDEVRICRVLDAGMQLQPVSVSRPDGSADVPIAVPIARVSLDASVEQAIAELAAALPATEFTPALLDAIRGAYAPGAGMAVAFARLLESTLGPRGLVVYDASDPAAKPLVAEVFAAEIERAGETSRLAAAAGARLESRGYHAQATPQAGAPALFHLGEGREPIRAEGDRLVCGGRSESTATLAELARRSPEAFSPGVLLRPIVQDTLFPTVCYVSGPNELAYLGQLRGVYEAFGVPMPLLVQRATATLVDANAFKFLTRYDCPFESLAAQDEAVLNTLLAAQLPPTVDAAMDAVVAAVERQMLQLAAELPKVDPTLEGAARSTLSRMQDDLKKLNGKIIQAAKRKDETLRRQFTHAQAQAFPAGHAQEREVAFVYFLNKYGPALVDRLDEELSLEQGQHQVIAI